jgi:integrase
VPLVRGKRPKRGRTVDRERELFKNLLPYFGDVPLVEITKARILAFSAERIKVPVSTGRRKGDKSPRNIGHELRFLRYLLNRGVDNDFLMAAPRIKVAQGGHRRNDLKQSEYEAMRKVMNPDAARYFAALWETGWRLNELRKLNWHKVTTEGLPLVDLKKGVLRLDAADVKEDYPRVTPISPELRKILLELKAGIASIDGAVFVRRTTGRAVKSIREAFLIAKEKAGCPNARPHDLRRSAIRRWEALGVSRQATMQASGHRPGTLHERYAELDEAQLLDAFQPLLAPRVKTGRQRAAILNGFKMKTHPLASDDRKTLTS